MNKRWLSVLSVALVIVFLFAACAPAARPQDDLYAAVNAEWLKDTKIPKNKIMVGGFVDLQEEVQNQLKADFDIMSPETASKYEGLPEFLKFYAMTSDYDTRNSQGVQPLMPYLSDIAALNGYEDLNAALPDMILNGLPTPVICGSITDFGDARYYALCFADPPLLLPDKSLYDTETGDYLFGVLKDVFIEMLKKCGYDKGTAALIAEEAIAFDYLIMPYMRPAEEAREYEKMNNPTSLGDFAAYSTSLDLTGLIKTLVPDLPESVLVLNPGYYGALNQVLTEDNFSLFKSWMIVSMVYRYSGMLSQDMAAAAFKYEKMLTGQAEMEDPQKLALTLAYASFSEPVGVYYGQTYFGEKAREDVTGIVNQLFEVYRNRLGSNEWLSKETVRAALNKLDKISLQIGYPDKPDPLYSLFKVVPAEDGGSVLGNIIEWNRLIMKDDFDKCGKETDKTMWIAGGADVNAFYNPQTNTIVFPAAILQEPFYSPDYSASRNLGGIGCIIGHEITHAFDPGGSKFDENGSISNWWTEEDIAVFEKRTEALAAQFDGVPYLNVQINGKQVVTEVVGDAGGLSAALEVCESLPDADVRAFFEGYATIFREKVRPELAELIITTSAYPPNELRVNLQVRNLDAFYTAFSVTEGDGMYLAPENRARVW